MTGKKKKSVTCYCEAYKFPHRMHSGECTGYHKKQEFKEPELTLQERMEIETGMTQKHFS